MRRSEPSLIAEGGIRNEGGKRRGASHEAPRVWKISGVGRRGKSPSEQSHEKGMIYRKKGNQLNKLQG